MAGLELSVLARQCLDQRLPSMEHVRLGIVPGPRGRNEHHVTIQWRFTPVDARKKLHRLYPSSS